MTYVIVGLGNVGAEYQHHRHNIGFTILDTCMRLYGKTSITHKYHSEYQQGEISGQKVHFLKPLTFMNRSGIAVSELCQFFKIPPEHVIVIHDDLDLPVFSVKMKQGGGAGGHNGLKSLDSHVGNNYHRIRIGIGRPAHKDQVHDWVLGNFNKDEKSKIPDIAEDISQKIRLFFEKNPNECKIKMIKQY